MQYQSNRASSPGFCGEKSGANGSDNSSGGNSSTGAKVGDVLDAPEKTISLDDIQDLTVTATVSLPSEGIEQKIINSISNKGDCVRFYENVNMRFEQICTVDDSGVAAYASNSGGEFYETEFDEVYGTTDGYFHYNLANLGVDFGNWMAASGFKKLEDETCQGNGIEYDDFEKLAMQENSEGFCGSWIFSDFLKENSIQRIESVELTHEVFMGESFVGSERVTEESELIRIEF